jgi:hypothetical protein
MEPTFGARLRQQREQQQVSLTAIAAATKIKVSLLEALERDDVSQWPKGIFRRAYLRDYARLIGLNPETVVREFLEVYPDPVVDAQTGLPVGEAPPPETRLRRFISAAIPGLRRAAMNEGTANSADAANSTDGDEAEPLASEPFGDPGAPGMSLDAPMVAEANDVQPMSTAAVAMVAMAAMEEAALAVEQLERFTAPPARRSDATAAETALSALAHLCTRLARVLDWRQLQPVLADAAAILDAPGLIVWSWDPRSGVLRPSLAHGYSDAVLSRLQMVRTDAANALAAAFRSGEPCVVEGGDGATGAVVVPLLTPGGCVGVLALELRSGRERLDTVRAFGQILAAQLSTLLDVTPARQAASA